MIIGGREKEKERQGHWWRFTLAPGLMRLGDQVLFSVQKRRVSILPWIPYRGKVQKRSVGDY